MDFLKRHYEKVLLGVVLVGLAVAVAFLPIKISNDKQSLEEKRNSLIYPKVKPLTNLDLATPEATLKRLAAPATIDFSAPNKLFNPMPWQKTADERLIPATRVGPELAVATNITPLYLRISLDSVTVLESGPRYVIGVQKEAEVQPSKRSKRQTYCTLNQKTDVFALIEVRGKPDDPTQLVLQLNDSGERAVISRQQPFQRVDGYLTDLRYDPEKKTWSNRRVGSVLSFNGEEYNIVAINQNEVVLSAKSNGKKWTVKSNPST